MPDTESAAIGRLLGGSGGDWGSWSAGGGCQSSWEPRGAGQFSFLYQEAQYRVTLTGNPPLGTITVRLRFFRKPWGAPAEDYALFAEQLISPVANESGVAQATGDVPIQQGYDTILQTCVRLNT